MTEVSIRPTRPEDTADLVCLGNELARLMGADLVFTADVFERYALGPKAHFEVLIAEASGKIVGYVLFEEAFNTDLGEPGMWLHDILVDEARRGQGIGGESFTSDGF